MAYSEAVERRPWIPLLVVIAGAIALRVGALRLPFFADDYLFLEHVRGRNLIAAILAPDPLGNFLRPMSRALHFWIFSRIGGESPLLLHAVNLALLAGILVLLHGLARRWVGPRGALFATAFVGLHYALDVPVDWVSGAQDLLAVLAALAALALFLRGRAWAAAAVLAFGLLSKETIVLTPILACAAAARRDEPWTRTLRRALPLFLVTALWAVLWIATLSSRPSGAAAIHAGPQDAVIAMLHLLQVALGLEFRTAGWIFLVRDPLAWLVPLVAVAALWFVAPGRWDAGKVGSARLDGRQVGLLWAVLGALPVAAVASIWSAYYYVFALFGLALFLATFVDRGSRARAPALLLLLGLLSANARALDEFATARGAWTEQSHVNRFYLRRAMDQVDRYLTVIKIQRPSLPHRATVFFADVPPSLGLQAADGPLLRWAYGDSSLRSYYLGAFSLEKARRGPMFFFAAEGEGLVDHTKDPFVLPSFAYSMLLRENAQAAQDAATVALERGPDPEIAYWRAWATWALGDTSDAAAQLRALGFATRADTALGDEYRARLAVKDTAGAVAALLLRRSQAVLNPYVHARLAALDLRAEDTRRRGVVEAYVYRLLAPRDPEAWRKWAAAQLGEQRYESAVQSLETYFALGGGTPAANAEAREVLASLRRILPGGDLAQQALRESPPHAQH